MSRSYLLVAASTPHPWTACPAGPGKLSEPLLYIGRQRSVDVLLADREREVFEDRRVDGALDDFVDGSAASARSTSDGRARVAGWRGVNSVQQSWSGMIEIG